MISSRFWWLGALVAVMACAGPPPASRNQPDSVFEYRIAPPDVLLINVRPEPIIGRQVLVRPDGKISFDLIGEVEVAGKTIPEVRQEIFDRIKEFIVAPDVTVTLEASNSRRYYVFGEVGQVGAYPLIGRVSVVEAVAAAGGVTRFASGNSARLTRPMAEGGKGTYAIRFNDITEAGDARTNYDLQPGDVIYVPPNTSAKIGYAIQVIFFPIQQIIGLGGQAARAAF